MLVVLEIQLKLQTAEGIDFLDSQLGCIGNRGAIGGSASGQRPNTADFDRGGLLRRRSASGKDRQTHNQRQSYTKDTVLLHKSVSPFKFKSCRFNGNLVRYANYYTGLCINCQFNYSVFGA
jgi:hypothetical protein